MYDPIAKSGDAEFSQHRHLKGSALAREMEEHHAFDSAWMNANAQAFVAQVKRSGPFLDIQPTHPAWIEHLRKKMTWRTTAYDAGPGLPAEPRAPVSTGDAAPTASKPRAKTGRKSAKKTVPKNGARKAATKTGRAPGVKAAKKVAAKKVAKTKRKT
ncbi:hypothetical protein D7W81_04955 [Corallococcus aberystwythensis]|uniref:Uncharacterized protein n=2 Tax=Corallococcus aberystwythensis TaxID=2316722 RepID=A0A3A8R168_9BACT|nr:hypothetical protein D7W81_04955 [Corallococcus aberystwythensis]